jgi:hypothetical protein
VKLVARLHLFTQSQSRGWEWLPPFAWLRRAPMVRRHVRRGLAALVDALFGPPASGGGNDDARLNLRAARRFVRQQLALLERDYRDDRRLGESEHATLGEHARALLLRPIASTEVTTDAEVLQDPASRVLSREDYERLRAQDDKASARRRRLMSSADGAAAALRHPESCAALLARSPTPRG